MYIGNEKLNRNSLDYYVIEIFDLGDLHKSAFL